MYLGSGCMKSTLPGCLEYRYIFTQSGLYKHLSGQLCTAHTLHQPVHLLLCAWCVFISVLWLWSRVHHLGQQWRGTSGVLHWEHLQGKPSTCQIVAPPCCVIQADGLMSARKTPDAVVITSDVCSGSCMSIPLSCNAPPPVPNHSWTCYLAS